MLQHHPSPSNDELHQLAQVYFREPGNNGLLFGLLDTKE